MRGRDLVPIVVALLVAFVFGACRTVAVIREGEPVTIAATPPPPPPPPPEAPPPPPVVQVEASRIRVDEKIQFELDSADISSVSNGLLDQIATVINSHPEVGRIRVEGHTDRQGAAQYNRTLSQRRAEAVVVYLVRKGVPRARLDPRGFGFDRPLGSNDTDDGRAQNRRVEFNFVTPPAAPAQGGAQ
ncbi:MAG: OmpA family protein [Deltaproteobacteria bacterium]|nr:OmpA family protein [Deltaproteobacteria bacterium]